MQFKFFVLICVFYFGNAFSHPHFGADDMEYFKKYISGEFAKRGLDVAPQNDLGFGKILLGTIFALFGLFFFVVI